MREIAPDVACLPLNIANVYFAGVRNRWILVDAGTPGKAECIREAAEERFGKGARPRAIVLTHGHIDHSGSALELANEWDVPIYAHRLEMPFLTGLSCYPPPDPTAPGAMAFLSRFVPSRKLDLRPRIQPFEAGQNLPGPDGWEWFHTPGHSPGHISLFREQDGVLLAGDAFATMNLDSLFAILTKAQSISRPPTPFTCDWLAAERSVRLLNSLKPRIAACGHGVPITGEEAGKGLAKLAKHFPVPHKGRYVPQPARTGDNGIVSLPPKPLDLTPKAAAALAIAGAALIVTRRLGVAVKS